MDNQALTVANVTIRQDGQGRFNLNDLHEAAGGHSNDAPRQWLRSQKSQELLEELTRELIMQNCTIEPLSSKRGRYGGTYVIKELVYAYAMWISPQFNIKVIRAYDEMVNAPAPQPEQPALPTDYLSALKALVASEEEKEQLAIENKEMSDELNYLTIQEFGALTHRYLSHSYKIRLAQRATKDALAQGVPLDTQDRVIVRKGKEIETSIKVYPRHILEAAEEKIAA